MVDTRQPVLAVTWVLLAAALVVIATLYLDLHQQYRQLETENRRLEAQQVLLMVPDGEAEALAEWLATHADVPRQWIDKHHKQRPEAAIAEIADDTPVTTLPSLPKVVSENDKGVKVIALPHGGIRVTTAEVDTAAHHVSGH